MPRACRPTAMGRGKFTLLIVKKSVGAFSGKLWTVQILEVPLGYFILILMEAILQLRILG